MRKKKKKRVKNIVEYTHEKARDDDDVAMAVIPNASNQNQCSVKQMVEKLSA